MKCAALLKEFLDLDWALAEAEAEGAGYEGTVSIGRERRDK
jgi:hypothetical protein